MTKIEKDAEEIEEDIEEDITSNSQRHYSQEKRSSGGGVNASSLPVAASHLDDRIDAKIRGAPVASTPGAVRSTGPISSKAAQNSASTEKVGSVESKEAHASTVKANNRGSSISAGERTRRADERVKSSVRASVQSAPLTALDSAPARIEPVEPSIEEVQDEREVFQADPFVNRENPVIYGDEQNAFVSPNVEHHNSEPYDVEDQVQQGDLQNQALEAFVPTTVVDATDVAIMPDEEKELQVEKNKFKKKAVLATICLVIICVAVIVPISLTYFKKSEETTVINIIPTASPTNMPSTTPSLSPTKSSYPEAVKSIGDFIQTKAAGFLKQDTTREQYTKKYTVPGTIQKKALEWIINDDKIDRPLNDPRWMQRLVLVLFYFAMTENKEWDQCGKEQDCLLGNGAKSWLSATDECDWYAVNCGDDEKVWQLNKVGNIGANGQFPDELGLLFQSLTSITWQKDSVYGNIPEAWQLLTYLKEILVARNKLDGPWPQHFFDKTPLLTTIYFHENNMNGPISPKIGNLKGLKELKIDANFFNETLPSEIGLLSSLKVLQLKNNSFVGKIPEEYKSLSLLTHLDLGYNDFSGPFPETFYNLDQVRLFDISHNNFTGDLTSKVKMIGEKNTKYKRIDLSNNKFEGNIPKEFGEIELLESLNLVNNSFVGHVADEICVKTGEGFGDLQRVSVNCENVTCTCCNPSCFPSNLVKNLTEKPTMMEKEHLDYSSAEDTTWTGEGRTAQNKAISWFFYDQGNWASFENPTQRVVLATLYYATTGENWTNNSFLKDTDECSWFGIKCNQEGSVVEIDLASNGLNGFLPQELQGLSNLTSLNVKNNSLSGQIPSTLGELENLDLLNLENSGLSGNLPPKICNITKNTQVDCTIKCEVGCCQGCPS